MEDPSLEEMTRAAIRMLANKERGFVVFIEEVEKTYHSRVGQKIAVAGPD